MVGWIGRYVSGEGQDGTSAVEWYAGSEWWYVVRGKGVRTWKQQIVVGDDVQVSIPNIKSTYTTYTAYTYTIYTYTTYTYIYLQVPILAIPNSTRTYTTYIYTTCTTYT